MNNRVTPLALGILLIGCWITACNRPVPAVGKSSPTSLAPTPDELSMTRTGIAGQIIATLTAAQSTPMPIEPQTSATPVIVLPTETSTQIATVPIVTVIPNTPFVIVTPSGQKHVIKQPEIILPEIYRLRKGEFPYCIARRYNINPTQLMRVNGFYYGQVFYPGQRVIIPDNPRPFPGKRALRSHPFTYRVRPGDTIFKISCYFGDIDPTYLAQLNGLSAPYRLTAGQQLMLP